MLYKVWIGSFMQPVFDNNSLSKISLSDLCRNINSRIREICSRNFIRAGRNQSDDTGINLRGIIQTFPLFYTPRSTQEKICDGRFAEELTQAMLRDLLYWCIFTDRMDMAKVLLLHIRTRICAALSCTAILRNRSVVATTSDKYHWYKQQAKNFEKYATDCIDICYSKNERKACELLIREEPLFGKITCMQVSLYLTVKLEPVRFAGGYFIA
jgi:hypothetical protein